MGEGGQKDYAGLLRSHGRLTEEQVAAQVRFRELVLKENEAQNLTRLVSAADFFEGHFLDAWELAQSGWVSSGVSMDLGSGLGVPGIPAALLLPSTRWVLAESEGRKAEFLSRAVEELGLRGRVSVFAGRAEEYLRSSSVETVVARAVGPVSRLWTWLGPCSTWNKWVLLKARGWDAEWSSPESKKPRAQFLAPHKIEYSVGAEQKYRVLIQLQKKPS